ncbi:hypothetical protein B0H14DRAFT_2569409 [Mycena olivaceomarginata]|nr:hypothetical protein B0H14DRAFT_2569409 [Mycena olivaceomarginata]
MCRKNWDKPSATFKVKANINSRTETANIKINPGELDTQELDVEIKTFSWGSSLLRTTDLSRLPRSRDEIRVPDTIRASHTCCGSTAAPGNSTPLLAFDGPTVLADATCHVDNGGSITRLIRPRPVPVPERSKGMSCTFKKKVPGSYRALFPRFGNVVSIHSTFHSSQSTSMVYIVLKIKEPENENGSRKRIHRVVKSFLSAATHCKFSNLGPERRILQKMLL